MWKCPKYSRKFKNTNPGHYCDKIETIDQYIAQQSEGIRPILHKIREVIRAAAPKSAEKISWQMPTFWQEENLIHFAAFKKHVGIYPGDLSLVPFEDRLTDYHRTKGAIQFPFKKPIDYDLIADITRWRVAYVEDSNKNNLDKNTSRQKRKIHDIPDYVILALDKSQLWERYRARPPYQRNDYIGWIAGAKREETRQKRLNLMLNELQSGNAYVGMRYNAK